jgi:hypothetical protein
VAGAHSANSETSSSVPLSTADLQHGESQLEQMLQDRPEMRKMVTKGDAIWLWVVRQLAGEACHQRIVVEDFKEPPFECASQFHNDGNSAVIRLRKTDRTGQSIPAEILWHAFIFECFNIKHGPDSDTISNQANNGKLSRKQYIEGITRYEFEAFRDTVNFYETVYLPFAIDHNYVTDPELWGMRAPSTYEAWIAQYTDPAYYPYDSYGAFYDSQIVPYLKAVAVYKAKVNAAGNNHQLPMNPNLAPGNVFDQDAATSQLKKSISVNNWHKVPAWCVGVWQSDQASSALPVDEKTGSADSVTRLATSRNTGLRGHYADKAGQVWEYEQAGCWTVTECDKYTYHGYQITRTPTVISKTECCFLVKSIVFCVDKTNGKIVSVARDDSEERIYPISPLITRTKTIHRLFDWLGNLSATQETVCDQKKTGDLAQDQEWKTIDGEAMYPLFVQYLKDHGMSDQIPEPVLPTVRARLDAPQRNP